MVTIRRLARFFLASLLWLHALLLFEVARPNLTPLAVRLHVNTGELVVISLIGAFSVLVAYGIGNLIVDLLYVYFFPFVLLYHCGRVAYKLIRLLNRVFARLGNDEVSPIDLHNIPGWPSPVVQPSSFAAKPPEGSPASTKKQSRRIRQLVTTPFLRFSLLWCLLLLLTSRPVLLWIALAVVLLHIGRVLVAIVGVAVFSTNWLSQLEDRIRARAETWINHILAANDTAPPDGMTQTVSALASLQLALALLRNRQRVAQWATFLGLLVFGAVYLYLALLFSFAYCGVARLAHVPLTWSESLVSSIFIPFAFTDLPKNPWLKTLAGFHASFVVVLGVSTVFGYLQKKLNWVFSIADDLNSRLQQPDVRTKIIVVAEKLKPNGGQPQARATANNTEG
jgi:hypothetical protein